MLLDQPAQVFCETCSDNFCEVCFAAQHRKGSRKRHASKPLSGPQEKKVKLDDDSAPHGNGQPTDGDEVRLTFISSVFMRLKSSPKMNVDEEAAEDSDEELERAATEAASSKIEIALSAQPTPGSAVGEWFIERAKFIPLRLTLEERKFLRLLEAALNVSEYTDKIDTIGFGYSKPKRIVHQIRELCAILSGLVLAADYKQVCPASISRGQVFISIIGPRTFHRP